SLAAKPEPYRSPSFSSRLQKYVDKRPNMHLRARDLEAPTFGTSTFGHPKPPAPPNSARRVEPLQLLGACREPPREASARQSAISRDAGLRLPRAPTAAPCTSARGPPAGSRAASSPDRAGID